MSAPADPEQVVDIGRSLRIAYERFGDVGAPAVLLIQGLSAQMLGWHEGFCAALVDRGVQVIRFDNRDIGRSTHLSDAPVPDFPAALAGDLSSAAYTLSDMAADAIGLLDALGIDGVHAVGVSMGGQIAQTMAIEHPDRVRSLTSISTTSGDPAVGQSWPGTWERLAGPPATNRGQAMDRAVATLRVAGSPGFVLDEAQVRERAGRIYERAVPDDAGMMRQAVATIASGDRTPLLQQLDVPALVVHGAADPMVDVSGGRATAAAIPGAELVVFEGMGHNIPRELWPEIADRIAGLVGRAGAGSSAAGAERSAGRREPV
ncbi:alpha/beta fold hydrolase [Pseudonocardia sp. GCM10023141]|uniref:alpha/beta fold hydrolase n=1 Tax=Pseudonocardia sp. GCM10023141 TaxID=3252653 RepID=UPI00360F0B0F